MASRRTGAPRSDSAEKPAGSGKPPESKQRASDGKPADGDAPAKKRPSRRRRKRKRKAPEAESAEAGPGATESKPAEVPKKKRRATQEKPDRAPETKRSAEDAKPAKTPKAPKTGSAASFDDIDLSDTMRDALAGAGYSEPTAVQSGVIPPALKGLDVMGQARTGTGKTAAFAIPIIERAKPRREIHDPQGIVLVPTRELAVQVHGEFEKLAQGRRFASVAVYGGKPIRGQIEKLRKGAQVVVGTPGRVLDHIGRRTLRLDDLRTVVLDEADRMLDIGFRPDIEKILRQCPKQRQTLLLSATVPPTIVRLAQRYMTNPKKLNFSSKQLAVESIEQFYFTVDGDRKFDLLEKLLEREDPEQAIVFCRTRRGTERIFRRLVKRHQRAACIHGDMVQTARDRSMAQFRAGKSKILVATDVVGRGIDVTTISHIINYDIPQFCDDYVHRVGRTGRMGREGVAFTFVTPEEGNELTRIEMRIDILLKRDEIEGFQPRERMPIEESQAAESAEAEPATPKRTPPARLGGRGRRHRRAL